MNRKVVSVFLLTLLSQAVAAIGISTGEIAVVTFDTLPTVGPTTNPEDPDVNDVLATWRFSFTLDRPADPAERLGDWTLNPGEVLRIQLFEDDTSDIPFFDTTATGDRSLGLSALATNGTDQNPPQWEDLQGLVVFTMVNGYVELDEVNIEVNIERFVYSGEFAPTPVPLPGALGLFLFGVGMLHRFSKLS